MTSLSVCSIVFPFVGYVNVSWVGVWAGDLYILQVCRSMSRRLLRFQRLAVRHPGAPLRPAGAGRHGPPCPGSEIRAWRLALPCSRSTPTPRRRPGQQGGRARSGVGSGGRKKWRRRRRARAPGSGSRVVRAHSDAGMGPAGGGSPGWRWPPRWAGRHVPPGPVLKTR